MKIFAVLSFATSLLASNAVASTHETAVENSGKHNLRGDSARDLQVYPKATFYDSPHFHGRSLSLGIGVYPFSFVNNKHFNDVTSSIRIDSGLRVVACVDDIGSHCVEYFNSVGSLGHYDNLFSSFKVQPVGGSIGSGPIPPFIVVYEHFDYKGRSLTLPMGRYDYHYINSRGFNDIVSSMHISRGYKVKACFHNFVHCFYYTHDVPRLGHENDQFSSFEVMFQS